MTPLEAPAAEPNQPTVKPPTDSPGRPEGPTGFGESSSSSLEPPPFKAERSSQSASTPKGVKRQQMGPVDEAKNTDT